ncbi:hypothetical protein GGR53DRAFT_353649 [Hypoxylon sp. FL1150]|nr:hypothetical protein GGR53DRAFT_353649 [Hypoxylon sp. FL1150]
MAVSTRFPGQRLSLVVFLFRVWFCNCTRGLVLRALWRRRSGSFRHENLRIYGFSASGTEIVPVFRTERKTREGREGTLPRSVMPKDFSFVAVDGGLELGIRAA